MWTPSSLLFELVVWVLPAATGILSCAYAGYSARRREAISTVMSCYVLSGGLVLFGALGTWRSGLSIWEAAGVAGDISVELLYEGWRYSWWPLSTSGGGAAVLLGIATAARLRPPQVLPTDPKADLAVVMAYPAVAVALLVVMGVVLEVAVFSSLPPYDFSPGGRLANKLMAIALLGYYLLAFLGIPYLVVWGTRMRRWRKGASVAKQRRVVTALYVGFALLTLAFCVLFFLSALAGHNPFLPGGGH